MARLRSVLTLFIFLFCACTNKESSLSEEEKIGYQAIFEYGKKIQNRGIQVIGFGGASKEGKTEKLDVTLSSDIELTIPVARKLIIELVDDFLKDVNANEGLKSYLSDYPFTAKNINMCLFGKKVKNNDDLLFYVAVQSSYISYEKKNWSGGLPITVLEETYDEAEHKLRETEK